MPVQSYRDLFAWQRAMDFTAEVYRVTRRFPKEELYGVTSQLRRAAVSVPSRAGRWSISCANRDISGQWPVVPEATECRFSHTESCSRGKKGHGVYWPLPTGH